MKVSRKSKKPSLAKPAKKSSKKTVTYPRRAGDVFVTQKMLFSVRDELIAYTGVKFHEVKTEFHGVKAEIHLLKEEMHELRSEIHGVKAEMHELRSEIHGVKAEMHELRSEIHGIKAEIHEVKAQISQLEKTVHKIALLVEEQNNRNKIVLDGLSHLFERQERIEKKVDSNLV